MSRISRRAPSTAVHPAVTLLAAACAALLLVSCGDAGTPAEGPDTSEGRSSSTSAPDPAAVGLYRGELDGGSPVVVAIDDGGRVLVSWQTVECGDDTVAAELDPTDALGRLDDGRFTATGAVTDEILDGDYTTTEVTADGQLAADGLRGTLRVVDTYVNGQGEDLGIDPSVCDTGEIDWTAERDPTGDPLAVFVFRDTADGDTTSFDRFVGAGGSPAVVQPIRGTNLVENVSASCIAEHVDEMGLYVGVGDDTSPFPGDDAGATIEHLVAAGVPVPPCHAAS